MKQTADTYEIAVPCASQALYTYDLQERSTQQKNGMTVYLAHPISGLGYDEVVDYFISTKKKLEELGYTVMHPMTAKDALRNEKKFVANGYENPESTNHAIIERDRWMVSRADIVYCNFLGAQAISIGCVMELAWAELQHKLVVIAMEKDNPHRHAFVLEAADVIFESHEGVISYFSKMAE